MVTRTLFCDYIVKYFSAHPAGVSLSFAGFKEASSHLGEPHVGRNCGKPQGAKSDPQQESRKTTKKGILLTARDPGRGP